MLDGWLTWMPDAGWVPWLVVGVILLSVNAVGVVAVALQLPGTWLIGLATGLAAWWGWGELARDADGALVRRENWIGWATLGTLLALAVLGEVVEAVAGAAGSRIAGGTRRGAVLAIIGGIAGAIAGTPLIPIPIVGTLVGASLGAGAGSILGDLWAKQPLVQSFKAGGGAAVGKFTGAVMKLAIAIAMWLVVAAAVVL